MSRRGSRRSRVPLPVLAGAVLVLAVGCSQESDVPAQPSPQASPRPTSDTPGSPSATPSSPAPGSSKRSGSSKASPTEARSTAPARPADPRWRFFTTDKRHHSSPWFPGRHPVMIPFGCTPAPYYSPDPSCPDGHGFHHGIDVAIPCGTPLRAGRAASVLDHSWLGPAYGANPVLLRVDGYDVVVGHTRKVFVRPGDRVARGEQFARVSDSGAPDGCHLHFEVRRSGGGVSDAVDPAPLLDLRG